MVWLPDGEISLNICLFVFDRMYERDRQADRQTHGHRMTAKTVLDASIARQKGVESFSAHLQS